MGKNAKKVRIELILKVLIESKQSQTISEIHDKLLTVYQFDVSRKTIERDMLEMVKKGLVHASENLPFRYTPHSSEDLILKLTSKEATYLMVVLPQEHSVYQKLWELMKA
jgi:predicted transcriptional regulator